MESVNNKNKIICVVGPTGVGKTKLSVMLAKKYNGVVVNADACQIYKELNIGTSKIKEEEKEGVTHLLFDIKKPNEDYSVSDYQTDLRYILNKYQDRNIIIVGGTGLYLTAGLFDYQFSERIDKDLSEYSLDELYDKCLEVDKDLIIDKHNRRRLENFLLKTTHEKVEPKLLYNAYFIGLTTDRNILYDKINKRLDEMVEEGLVSEVKNLYEKYGDVKILKRAIGYKEIISYLDGEITLDEAVLLIKKNTRHYAKRQYTWFNNKMDVTWFQTDYNNFNNTYNDVINYIENTK